MQPVTEIAGPAGSYTAWVAGPPDGEVVLLLHGFPQTRHTWRHQVPALAAVGYRVVAPDQRGYSPGARPDPSDLSHYGIDLLIADALALAAAGGVTGRARFHLVGHDWGGAIAWMLAAHHAERLHSLSVLSRPHPQAFRRALQSDADGHVILCAFENIGEVSKALEASLGEAESVIESGRSPFESTTSSRQSTRDAAASTMCGRKKQGNSSVTIAHARCDSARSSPLPAPTSGSTYGK